MLKTLLKISLGIFANLLAFLFLGHILDAIFKTEVFWKITMLVLSIIPLCLILLRIVKSHTSQLENISQDTTNNGSNKS